MPSDLATDPRLNGLEWRSTPPDHTGWWWLRRRAEGPFSDYAFAVYVGDVAEQLRVWTPEWECSPVVFA